MKERTVSGINKVKAPESGCHHETFISNQHANENNLAGESKNECIISFISPQWREWGTVRLNVLSEELELETRNSDSSQQIWLLSGKYMLAVSCLPSSGLFGNWPAPANQAQGLCLAWASHHCSSRLGKGAADVHIVPILCLLRTCRWGVGERCLVSQTQGSPSRSLRLSFLVFAPALPFPGRLDNLRHLLHCSSSELDLSAFFSWSPNEAGVTLILRLQQYKTTGLPCLLMAAHHKGPGIIQPLKSELWTFWNSRSVVIVLNVNSTEFMTTQSSRACRGLSW